MSRALTAFPGLSTGQSCDLRPPFLFLLLLMVQSGYRGIVEGASVLLANARSSLLRQGWSPAKATSALWKCSLRGCGGFTSSCLGPGAEMCDQELFRTLLARESWALWSGLRHAKNLGSVKAIVR